MLRSEHRLDSLLSRESIFLANNLVLVGALLRDLLGHLLPADLRGADRPGSLRRAAVVRPLHGAAGAGPRAAERHRPGDRLAAGDARQRPAQLPRAARSRRSRRCVGAASSPASPQKPFAIAMFCCAAFVFGSVGQEFFRGARARRAMAGEPAPRRAARARAAQPPPLRRLHRAHRHRRAVRRRRRLLVLPARLRARALAGPVRRASAPTRSATCARPRRSRRSTTPPTPARRSASGLCSTSPRTAATSPRCDPSEGFYASEEAGQGTVGSLIGGQPVSHVAHGRAASPATSGARSSPTSKPPRCSGS